MAFDEALAERIRRILQVHDGVTERKMFGGLAFMVNGNMCCGVQESEIMLRLGNEGAAAALTEPHARAMDFTGRPMKSMIYVGAAGIETEDTLRGWSMRAHAFAEDLPAK